MTLGAVSGLRFPSYLRSVEVCESLVLWTVFCESSLFLMVFFYLISWRNYSVSMWWFLQKMLLLEHFGLQLAQNIVKSHVLFPWLSIEKSFKYVGASGIFIRSSDDCSFKATEKLGFFFDFCWHGRLLQKIEDSANSNIWPKHLKSPGIWFDQGAWATPDLQSKRGWHRVRFVGVASATPQQQQQQQQLIPASRLSEAQRCIGSCACTSCTCL